MIGPLYLPIATYVSLLNNICTSWYLLTLTQMTLVKVLMIFKWSFMTGIDDNFVGEFLILVNVGFLSLSQLSRHWLGSMYESQEFHMLSGKICIRLFSWCLLVGCNLFTCLCHIQNELTISIKNPNCFCKSNYV